jgi:hypothetical protein
MPIFQPKHRAFVGIVFFESKNPMTLPWTTTKRSLNRESSIYLRTRNRMAIAAKPVLSFISKTYPTDPDIAPAEREVARTSVVAAPAELASAKASLFAIPTPAPGPRLTQTVVYIAKITDLEKVRKHLRQPRLSASRIGEHTFHYFMKQEGLE